jgi:hypothetical protein
MSPREYSLENPPARLGVDCRSCEHLQAFVDDIEKYKQFGVTASWAIIHAERRCKGTPQPEITEDMSYWMQEDAKLCTIGLLKSTLDAEINKEKYSGKTG